MNELLTELRHFLSIKMMQDSFIEEFDEACVGKDTSDLWRQFAIWMLVDPEHGVIRFTEPGTHEHHAIQRVAQLFIDDCKDAAAWSAAWSAACDAADAAACDAAFAAAFAAAACAAGATWSAARSAADAAAGAVGNDHYQTMADKLNDLIKKSPEAT